MRKSSFAIRRVGGRDITAVSASSEHSFARHTHDEYGIGVMLAGVQRSWSGRGTVEANAGDLITVNPGEVHDGSPIGGSRSWAMLYLSPQSMAGIVSDIRGEGRADFEFVDPVMRNRREADQFLLAFGALGNGADEAAAELIMMLVAGLLQDTSASRIDFDSPMTQVKARIDDDPAGHHPLDELARDAGASSFSTLRSFTRLTGLTPHAYVVQRRLDSAKAMICGGASLADVANRAGFADQSHFHRSFTRRYGLTPGAFAKAMR